MSGSGTRSALDLLRQTPRLAELAAFPFDFDLDRAEHGEDVHLASGDPLTGIAGDDTGGTYFLCQDGGVLYADSDGRSGLVAESVTDALELVAGLPAWRDHLSLPPEAGQDEISAAAREAEAAIRDSYAPDLDALRQEFLTGLGLTLRPPADLFARMYRALARTEPDHLLLLAEEGCAYEQLGAPSRPAVSQTVLAACAADLERLRADRTAWAETDFVPVPSGRDPEHDAHSARRACVLHAARYDRQPTDLALLRHLLEQETISRRRAPYGGMGEELHLAVFLVARFGCEEDLPRLFAARCANFDTWCALSDLPLGLVGKGQDEEPAWEPEALRRWVEALDTPEWFGDDPEGESDETWVTLARRRGLTELARTTLIRALDNVGPADTAELPWLIDEFIALGDLPQAARAQRLYAKLQDTAPARGAAYTRLAALERQCADDEGARASLRRALDALDGPPEAETHGDQLALINGRTRGPAAGTGWTDTGLGLLITKEHFHLASAAAANGRTDIARWALATGAAILARISRPSLTVYRAAHVAAVACQDSELASRYAQLAAREEHRMGDFPYDLDEVEN